MKCRRRWLACSVSGVLLLSAIAVYSVAFGWPNDVVNCDDRKQQVERSPAYPDEHWCYRKPEDLGVDEEAISALAGEVGWLSVGCVVKDGYVIYSWGGYPRAGNWASASKPLMATVLLFACHQGRIERLDAEVAQTGLPLAGGDSEMTWKQIVNMMGNYGLPEEPGEAWAYNDYNYRILVEALFDYVYGVPASDAQSVQDVIADERRLGPLQFHADDLIVERGGSPRVSMTPEDYARVGWFWLQRGQWQNEQLLPESFFDTHFAAGIPDDALRTELDGSVNDYLGIGSVGGGVDQTAIGPGVYGFYMWHNEDRQIWPDVPEDAYQANGAWNRHAMTVIPELDVVVAWRRGYGVAEDPDTFHRSMNEALKIVVEAIEGSEVRK